MIWTLISFFGVIAKEKYVWGLKEQKMISNQILQNTIEGLKGIARVELCVMDVDGKEVAATMDMGNCSKPAVEFAASPADSQEIQGYQYFKIYDEQQLEYILVAGGTGEDVYMIGKMVAFQIQNLLVPIRRDLIRTISSRICCWIICCWWISTAVPRSCIFRQTCPEWS